MLKLAKMTDYAVVILANMAGHRDRLVSASTLAKNTSLPEPTVSKILKLLSRHELITSSRGVSGGYRLNKDPTSINMADVIAATDAPVALTACVDTSKQCCELEDTCTIKGKWNPVNTAMRAALENVSLQQMIGGAHE